MGKSFQIMNGASEFIRNLSVLSKNIIESNHFENFICFYNNNILQKAQNFMEKNHLLAFIFSKYATSEAHRLHMFSFGKAAVVCTQLLRKYVRPKTLPKTTKKLKKLN